MSEEGSLSAFISRLVFVNDDAIYDSFCAAFLDAQVGVTASGIDEGNYGKVVSTEARPLSVGLTTHADGRDRILACADPAQFEVRYGRKFNALMLGRELAKTALFNPDCAGILVNSALSENSIAIDREKLALLLAPPKSSPSSPKPPLRPWWKFW